MPLWLPWADLSFRLVAFGFQPSVTVPVTGSTWQCR